MANINKARFINSGLFDILLSKFSPFALYLFIFSLTFLAQFILTSFEGTLFPSSKVQISFVEHLTVMVGGSFLIPMIFFIMKKFYLAAENAVGGLKTDNILNSEHLETLETPNLNKVLSSVKIGLIALALIVDSFIFFGGPHQGIDYIHMINGKLTICGYYYVALFPFLAYFILIFLTDVSLFANAVGALCKQKFLTPSLFHPDGKYGLRELVNIIFPINFFILLIGAYFFVIFLNWMEYKSPLELIFNVEEILIIIGYFSITPLILSLYIWPVKKTVADFKNSNLHALYSLFKLQALNNLGANYPEILSSLQQSGFYLLYNHVANMKTNLVSFDLLGKIYRSVLIPIVVPLLIAVIKERFLK